MLPPTAAELERKLFKPSKVEWLETLPHAMHAQLTLNFQVLTPLEAVSLQFKAHGIVFREAIALIPSNPRFIYRSGQTVLIPKSSQVPITIELSAMIHRLSLWGRSTHPITLQAMDNADQIITTQTGVMCPLPGNTQSETSLLPRQVFKLGTTAVSKVVIFSKNPLVIEGIRL